MLHATQQSRWARPAAEPASADSCNPLSHSRSRDCRYPPFAGEALGAEGLGASQGLSWEMVELVGLGVHTLGCWSFSLTHVPMSDPESAAGVGLRSQINFSK